MLELIDLKVAAPDGRTLLENVNLQVVSGETIALLGASGSGKSTLLRAVTGLAKVTGGDIRWCGASVLDTPPHRRGFGMVFQDAQLFENRSVAGNIAYGLEVRQADGSRLTKQQRQLRVNEMLQLVGLSGFADRRPSTLSGGQAQRIALARALAPKPAALMLDEPLSALDSDLRVRLAAELKLLLKNTTAIFVTHDKEEAALVADRIVRIEDIATQTAG
ncbi:ABC transporter ATP-binding protein [Canibacter zhoujuaniae]|uniref:ABC transporter ATP-binding protein n=1 Tax=Canibacter zhoujuaniae TaxID=2708343 RepID=UPI001423933D|nr:ABC transporter ATP-binding protein [Canibacter zhoujuaniae]